MKSYLKNTSILPVAVMFLTVAFTNPASASAKDLQISGHIETLEVQLSPPPAVNVQLEGTGCARHLGLYSLSIDEIVTFPALPSVGSFELTTGHGDTLFGTVIGQGAFTANPIEVSIVEQLTITGGTGRFKNATGTITVCRLLNLPTDMSPFTIEGTIDLHERSRCRRGR